MTVWWLCLSQDALPTASEWLGPRERETLSSLTVDKRRSDWLLGRYVAKSAIAHLEQPDELHTIEVIASKGGAPEAFISGDKLAYGISISHRAGVGACAVTERRGVGCDLEVVEPRTSRFVADYFTPAEQVVIENAHEDHRQRLVALTWSAKESALKVLGVGLRRDTRKVHVSFANPAATQDGWNPLEARVEPEAATLHGWWRKVGQLVLTVLAEGPRTATPLRVPGASTEPP